MHAETTRLIGEATARAERLIAIVRMVVALALATTLVLQVVSEFTTMSGAAQGQVIFAAASLAFYLIFGIVSYRIAGGRPFGAWLPWVFAALDISFVLFHLNHSLHHTGLPPAFMAGFVAIWLVPLILAFGALRYSPYLQAFVTLGLLGGIALLAVGTGFDPLASVDLGPEALFDLYEQPPNAVRLTILVLVGLILIVAAARTRTLLRHAVEETRHAANLTRYLPPQFATWLADADLDAIRGGQHQRVAILFADIRGFTARAHSMSAADLTDFIGEFRACVTAAADAHHGVIDKFIGDSAMVVFGVPEPDPRDARHALDCARAILDNVAAWNVRLAEAKRAPVEIGIGVHCGEVFCGAVGDAARLEFTVLGDPVNVASRIEQHTRTAGHTLLVSRALLETAEVTPDDGRWIPLPQQTLRGRAEPIDLFAAAPPA